MMPRDVWCQQDSLRRHTRFWVDFGYGLGKKGRAYNFDLNLKLKSSWVLSLRTAGINQADTSKVPSCPDKTNITGGSFMIGHLWEIKNKMILVSSGLSFVDFHRDPCLNTLGRHRPGIGIDISAKVLFPWKFLAVGLNPFININDVSNYYGMTFNLGLGRLFRSQR